MNEVELMIFDVFYRAVDSDIAEADGVCERVPRPPSMRSLPMASRS